MIPSIFPLIRNIFATITCLFILTSCTKPSGGTTAPTIEWFDLYYPPSLRHMRERVSMCIYTLGSTAPYLHEKSTGYKALESGDIVLTLGEVDWGEENYFVTQIASEKIAFIVNQANPVESIDMEELSNIFSGKQTTWSSGTDIDGQIDVWVYADGSDLMNWLSDSLRLGNHMNPASRLAPHPDAMLQAVSNDAGAVGFLPASWLEAGDLQFTNRIKTLSVSELDEQDISRPVLAYLAGRPAGGVQDFLICLQDR